MDASSGEVVTSDTDNGGNKPIDERVDVVPDVEGVIIPRRGRDDGTGVVSAAAPLIDSVNGVLRCLCAVMSQPAAVFACNLYGDEMEWNLA